MPATELDSPGRDTSRRTRRRLALVWMDRVYTFYLDLLVRHKGRRWRRTLTEHGTKTDDTRYNLLQRLFPLFRPSHPSCAHLTTAATSSATVPSTLLPSACFLPSSSFPPSPSLIQWPSLLPSDSESLSRGGALDRAGADEDVALGQMLVPCLASNSGKSLPKYMCSGMESRDVLGNERGEQRCALGWRAEMC